MKYYRKTLFIFFLTIFILLFPNFESDPFFNTNFLRQPKRVRKTLIDHYNFKEITFNTPDNIKLSGLFKKQGQACCNVICCAGFYPGRKEGMATFFKIIPHNCNILFFDARGHGKSKGRFWSNAHRYGIDEYKDIIGAINYMHQEYPIPTIIIGLCAGAFHATRALLYLQEKESLEKYSIKGLIFDSGFGSLVNVLSILPHHTKEALLPTIFTVCYQHDSKHSVKTRYPYHVSSYIASKIIGIATYLIRSSLQKYERYTNLFGKISELKCPIFFIHAHNDSYVPIKNVMLLAQNASQSTYWWIEHSTHACNHLKHKYIYHKKVLEFLSSVLNT